MRVRKVGAVWAVRDRERERGAPLGVRAQVWLSECLRERVCVAVKLKGEREKKGWKSHPKQSIIWKLAKICAQTKLTWLSVLPLILMFVRSSVNRISGFTPFELLTGRSFPGPSTPLRPDHISPLSHCVYFDKLTALIKIFPAGHCRQWSQMDWTPESHLKNIALCPPSRKRRHLVSFVCLYFMWPP